MESYFSKLKSQADAQLQGATDPAALAEKEEEDRKRLQAVRQDALVRGTQLSRLIWHPMHPTIEHAVHTAHFSK